MRIGTIFKFGHNRWAMTVPMIIPSSATDGSFSYYYTKDVMLPPDIGRYYDALLVADESQPTGISKVYGEDYWQSLQGKGQDR